MTILSDQDSGRTVEVALGNVVIVRLKENATTGYRWTIENSGGLEEAGSKLETGGAIGVGGLREFQFRAVRTGVHELRLKNWREWEGDGSTTARFNAQIVVK